MSGHRGSALVSAMMVLMVIVGLVAALAPLVRVDVRAAGQAADGQRALYLARAGVNLALATLQQDDPSKDGLDEDWAALGGQRRKAVAARTSTRWARGSFGWRWWTLRRGSI